MNKKILLLIALAVTTQCFQFSFSNLLRSELKDSSQQFMEFVTKQRVNYLTVEEMKFRKAVFEENLAVVEQLNQDKNQTAYFEANKFIDRTKEEFNQVLGGMTDENRTKNLEVALSKMKSESSQNGWFFDEDENKYWRLESKTEVKYVTTSQWFTYDAATWTKNPSPNNISF